MTLGHTTILAAALGLGNLVVLTIANSEDRLTWDTLTTIGIVIGMQLVWSRATRRARRATLIQLSEAEPTLDLIEQSLAQTAAHPDRS